MPVGKKRPKVIITPYNLLDRKGKREYAKPGRLKVMIELLEKYDSREKIEELPYEEAQQALLQLRRNYSNKEIMERWKMSSATFQRFCDKYKVQKVGGHRPKVWIGEKDKRPESTRTQKISREEKQEIRATEVQPIKPQGFNIIFNGEYKGEDISNKLLALSEFIKNENKYTIELSIKENLEDNE